MLAAAAGTVAALTLPRIARAAPAASDLGFVHPELRAVAAILQRNPVTPDPAKPASDLPIPAGVRRLGVPGASGAPPVPVYLANEVASGPPRGAILYFHGGGFVRGNALQGIAPHIAMAKRLNCALISVEYRLAPGTPYPGALDDAYAVLAWLGQYAARLGIRADRIALMGESAGGGLAAMLAIAARDRGVKVRPCFQALVYPMLDDRTGNTRPVPPNRGTFVWTADDNRKAWAALLGRKAGSGAMPSGAVPARVRNLAGLPPAWIGVGGIDLFVDEDVDYAQRLLAAGVATELLVIPGAFHAFQRVLPQAAISKQFNAALEAALARALS